MKTPSTPRQSPLKPSTRRFASLALLVTVALTAAGCGADSDAARNSDTASDAAASGPSKIGPNGPQVGDCLADVDASTSVVNATVPCTTEHTVEVVGVIAAPADLDPEDDADAAKISKLAAVGCPDRRDYVGYGGDLTGVIYNGWVTANADAREAGSRWVACGVAFYDAAEPGSALSGDLVARDSSIKDTVPTDADFLAYGTLCLNQPSPGDATVCDPDKKRQFMALAVRPDRQPFKSRTHQLETSRAFCAKVAPKYTGRPDPQRWAFFSETAQEYYGQNCIIPLTDFTGPQT